MLLSYFSSIEKQILLDAEKADLMGNTTNVGRLREIFIRNFLKNNLSQKVGIGRGEIIDCTSRPDEKRDEIDIVIYRNDYPKLHFDDKTDIYLAESIISTIEVKSRLNKKALLKTVNVARNLKRLRRDKFENFSAGYFPPNIFTYLVSYYLKENLLTAYTWLNEIHNELSIRIESPGKNRQERCAFANTATIDGIFIIGKGYILFDNHPVDLIEQNEIDKDPELKWSVVKTDNATLLQLFNLLLKATSGIATTEFNFGPYLRGGWMRTAKH